MKRVIIILLFLICTPLNSIGQVIPYNQEFHVSTYTNGYQSWPTIAALSDGGFVVCWISEGQDGSEYGVIGQRFDSYGEKIGLEFQVNTYTESYQSDPCLAALSDVGFVVCWESAYQDGSSSEVFGKYFFKEPLQHQLAPFSHFGPANDASVTKKSPIFIWHEASLIRKYYPNPFNATTTIRYDMPTQSHVTLRIYDILGRLVAELVNAEVQSAGAHAVVWDGTDNSGRVVPSGLYVYSLQVDGIRMVKKMVVLE
ncbi:T9SS type A sorting domain-containing protein [candidate division KSB1 bacterium]|nr:T9SS type A sorting domain-containing protein [candidate division KSB1 bacterium]